MKCTSNYFTRKVFLLQSFQTQVLKREASFCEGLWPLSHSARGSSSITLVSVRLHKKAGIDDANTVVASRKNWEKKERTRWNEEVFFLHKMIFHFRFHECLKNIFGTFWVWISFSLSVSLSLSLFLSLSSL